MAALLGGLAASAGGVRAPIEADAPKRVPAPPEATERQPLGANGPQEGPCETFSGDVADGEAFGRPFGDGLLFRLRPTANAPPNPRGWTIEVRAAPEEDHDFVWVATPPYRFSNPRYLEPSYGRTAAEAVAWRVRPFGFVTTEEQYDKLAEATRFITSSRPLDMSPEAWKARHDTLRARWSAMMDSVGQGELRITDAEVTGPEEAPPGGRIERIAFEVALCPGGGDTTDALDGPRPSRPPFDPAAPVDPPEEGAPAGVSDSAVGQEAHQELPEAGRALPEAGDVAVDSVDAGCLELGWPEPRGALSDSIASRDCRVAEAGRLPRTGPTGWHWALYRRVVVYEADGDTPERNLDLLPDTLREDELVLFAGPTGDDRIRPMWHDRTDASLELLRPPRSGPVDEEAALFVQRRCFAGTGGCRDLPFRLTAGGGVEALMPAYLGDLEDALPEEWGTRKGVHIDPAGPSARAPVYLPGDPNCCAAFRADLSLRIGDGRLSADAVVVAPDTTSRFWRVDPAEGRFGPMDGGTTESELRGRAGDSRVERTDVHLGEGSSCTAGVRVFAGTPWAFEVAWADSSRSRPAFARVTRDETLSHAAGSSSGRGWSPFRTATGVRLGTPLEELEVMAGGPVRFSGFGWDDGGRAAWTAEGGELVLRLFYDPVRLNTLQAGADSSRLDVLFGDRRVRSDRPLVERLGVRVVSMRLDWRSPEALRFCG